MEDLLTAVRADVGDKAPAVGGDTLLRGQLPGNLRDATHQFRLLIAHLTQISEMPVGNDQQMDRRLG